MNQNVNQRDQDFDNLVGRYLRKTNAPENPQPKASNLDSIKLAYKTIMSQNKNQDQSRMGFHFKDRSNFNFKLQGHNSQLLKLQEEQMENPLMKQKQVSYELSTDEVLQESEPDSDLTPKVPTRIT